MNDNSALRPYIEGNHKIILLPHLPKNLELPESIKKSQARIGYLFLIIPAVIVAILLYLA